MNEKSKNIADTALRVCRAPLVTMLILSILAILNECFHIAWFGIGIIMVIYYVVPLAIICFVVTSIGVILVKQLNRDAKYWLRIRKYSGTVLWSIVGGFVVFSLIVYGITYISSADYGAHSEDFRKWIGQQNLGITKEDFATRFNYVSGSDMHKVSEWVKNESTIGFSLNGTECDIFTCSTVDGFVLTAYVGQQDNKIHQIVLSYDQQPIDINDRNSISVIPQGFSEVLIQICLVLDGNVSKDEILNIYTIETDSVIEQIGETDTLEGKKFNRTKAMYGYLWSFTEIVGNFSDGVTTHGELSVSKSYSMEEWQEQRLLSLIHLEDK